MPMHFALAILRLVVARIRGRADLLHVHMASHGSAVRKPLLALVGMALGVRTVMHLHSGHFEGFLEALHPLEKKLLLWVIRRCDRVIVIGSRWHDLAVKHLGFDPGRVVLIHNGVPTPSRSAGKMVSQAPKLLMLSVLDPMKGTPDLIEALGSAEVRRRNWSATLAGSGPVEEFRSQVAALGLEDRIDLPGWQAAEKVRVLLDEADVVLLPSRAEGLPVSILEAMASEVAVIATPVGAIADAIRDGETGLLVPPGDVQALSDAIMRLIDDSALRQHLALNARARFESMFTIEHTADRVAALYGELGIGQRPG
jgi:glycosyltransferase involved in cell wall biosynthesis